MDDSRANKEHEAIIDEATLFASPLPITGDRKTTTRNELWVCCYQFKTVKQHTYPLVLVRVLHWKFGSRPIQLCHLSLAEFIVPSRMGSGISRKDDIVWLGRWVNVQTLLDPADRQDVISSHTDRSGQVS